MMLEVVFDHTGGRFELIQFFEQSHGAIEIQHRDRSDIAEKRLFKSGEHFLLIVRK
jgi:hypothetical protein